ncbi:MAG TPA: hypothetical protein VK673_01010 [Chthoniobacterales bacterium]|nr:hypothetical protein [Chthoniobacterales bacterium]
MTLERIDKLDATFPTSPHIPLNVLEAISQLHRTVVASQRPDEPELIPTDL